MANNTSNSPGESECEQMGRDFWRGRTNNGAPLGWKDMTADERTRSIAEWRKAHPVSDDSAFMTKAAFRAEVEALVDVIAKGVVEWLPETLRPHLDPYATKETLEKRLSELKGEFTSAIWAHVTGTAKPAAATDGDVVNGLSTQIAHLRVELDAVKNGKLESVSRQLSRHSDHLGAIEGRLKTVERK